jgi:O-antigen/teichoic acid export membrane protein
MTSQRSVGAMSRAYDPTVSEETRLASAPDARADVRERLSLAGRGTVVMTIAPLAASLVVQAWLGREIGRSGLGEYHALALFVVVLTSVGILGAPSAASQRVASLYEDPGARARATDTAFGVAGVTAVGLGLGATLLWPALAAAMHVGTPASAALAGAATSASVLSSFAVHLLLGRLDASGATVVVVSQPIGVAVGIVSGLTTGPLAGDALAAVGFISSGALAVALLLRSGARPAFALEEARHLIRRSVAATVVAYPAVITGWIDRAVIGALLGPSALGAFVAASTLVEAVQRLLRALASLGVPAYAHLSADPVGARRVLDSHLRIVAFALIVVGSVFIAAGNGILSLVFGEGFVIATTTLRLLAIALLPLGIASVIATHSIGAGGGLGRMATLLAPAQLVLALVGTMIFHIAGTALANVILWFAGALAFARMARRRGAPVDARTLLRTAGLAAPLFVASWYIALQPVPWPARGLAALAIAAPIAAVVLIRDPEVRMARRLLDPAGGARRSE